MVIGCTHDPDGRVVLRLAVSTKVAIGLPPNGDRNHLTKLDHFAFLRKKKTANRVGWEVDLELSRAFSYRGEHRFLAENLGSLETSCFRLNASFSEYQEVHQAYSRFAGGQPGSRPSAFGARALK